MILKVFLTGRIALIAGGLVVGKLIVRIVVGPSRRASTCTRSNSTTPAATIGTSSESALISIAAPAPALFVQRIITLFHAEKGIAELVTA